MLQQADADDYVVATGVSHSVGEFLDEAFGCVDMEWREHVELDRRYLRPTEVDELCGDTSKAERDLGWQPRVKFRELVRMMVDADMELARQEQHAATPQDS